MTTQSGCSGILCTMALQEGARSCSQEQQCIPRATPLNLAWLILQRAGELNTACLGKCNYT